MRCPLSLPCRGCRPSCRTHPGSAHGGNTAAPRASSSRHRPRDGDAGYRPDP